MDKLKAFALKIYCEKVKNAVTLHNDLAPKRIRKEKPPSPALDSGYMAAITSQAALISTTQKCLRLKIVATKIA